MPLALVTGATGFVGSHLVDLLCEQEWDVTVTVRPGSSLEWLRGKSVHGVTAQDLRSLPPFDVVFHVAGLISASSWGELLAVNRDFACQVFDSVQTKRFVLISSIAVTGPGRGVDETTPCRPISLYGKSKWEGEQAIRSRSGRVPVTVIRPPPVYGPRDKGLLELYRALANGMRFEIGGRKEISLVYVRDLVEGILLAAESPEAENETFLLTNREPLVMSDLMDLILEKLGRTALRIPIPDRVVRLLGGVLEDVGNLIGRRPMFGRDKAIEMTQEVWACRPDKARRIIGWEAQIPVYQGMAETIRWYQREGLL